MVREHGDSAYGDALKNLAAEISQDRQSLLQLLADLDVAVKHYKVYGAWLGKKIGRVKPNGRLLCCSGLTVLIELEALRLGEQGKVLLWRALLLAAAQDSRLDATAAPRPWAGMDGHRVFDDSRVRAQVGDLPGCHPAGCMRRVGPAAGE